MQALVHGPTGSRAELAKRLIGLVATHGPLDVAPPLLEAALDGLEEGLVRTEVVCSLAEALHLAGRLVEAERAHEAAALARRERSQRLLALALIQLSAIRGDAGHLVEATAVAREAVAAAEAADAKTELYLAVCALGGALSGRTSVETIPVLERAGALATELGRPVDAAIAIANAGAARRCPGSARGGPRCLCPSPRDRRGSPPAVHGRRPAEPGEQPRPTGPPPAGRGHLRSRSHGASSRGRLHAPRCARGAPSHPTWRC